MKNLLQIRLTYSTLLLIVLATRLVFAQTTTWKGTTNSSWTTAANWIGTVPTATSDVVINSCTTCPALPASVTIRSLKINSGGKLDIGNHTLVASSVSLVSATLASSNGYLKTINLARLEYTVVNGNATLEKTAGTGSVANVLYGGNLFNSPITIINSSTTTLTLGNISKDVFNDDLTLTNTGTGGIFMAQNGVGHQFKGNLILNKPTGTGIYFCEGPTATAELAVNKTLSIGSGGFPSGELRLKRFVQQGSTTQTLTLTGTAILRIATGAVFNGSVAFKAPQLYLDGGTFRSNSVLEKNGATDNSSSGGNVFDGTATITNSGSGNLVMGNVNPDIFNSDALFNNTGNKNLQVANNSINNLFNGTTIFNQLGTGTASNTYVSFNPLATATFLGPVLFNNAGSGSNNLINLNRSGACRFKDNIQVSSTVGKGIWFGELNGKAQLDSAKTISLASAGFSAGELRLKNFRQQGEAAQNLTLTGTSTLRIGNNSHWEGEVTMKAPQLLLDGGTYLGKTSLEKTGAGSNISAGGNTFWESAMLTNSGSGSFMLGNTLPDSAMASLAITNRGGSSITIAANTKGNWLGGKVIINNEAGSFYIADRGVSGITFSDSVLLNNRSTGSVFVANQANSQATFSGYLGVKNLQNAVNPLSNNLIYLGYGGVCRMKHIVQVSNTSKGNASGIIFGNAATARDTLAATARLEVGPDGFARGQLVLRNLAYLNPENLQLFLSAGVFPDTNTSLLSVGGNSYFATKVNFTSPQLSLNGGMYAQGGFFNKLGVGSNSGGGNIYYGKAVFNLFGNAPWDIALNVPEQFKDEAEFNNFSTQVLRIGGNSKGTVFEKKTIFNNASTGSLLVAQNNLSTVQFRDTVLIHNNSSGLVQLASQAGSLVEFAKEVWFDGAGTGAINAPNAGVVNYKGDMVINRKVAFGVATTAEVKLSGNENQLLYKIFDSPIAAPAFQKLTVDKQAGKVLVQLPLTVTTNLLLKRGIVEMDAPLSNTLSFARTATVTGGNDLSFVKGLVSKTGNTTFTFPLGDNGRYRPVRTGALYTTGTTLAANTVTMTAGYIASKQTQGALRTDERLSLSPCEYWSLRSSAMVKCRVSLKNKNACNADNLTNTDNPAGLRVARYFSSKWQPEGNVPEGDTVLTTAGDIPFGLNGTQYFTLGYWNQLTLNTSRMNRATFKLSGLHGLPLNRTFTSGTDSSKVHVYPTVTTANDTFNIQLLGDASLHIQPITLLFQTNNQSVLSLLTPIQVNTGGAIKPLSSNYYEIRDDLYTGKTIDFYPDSYRPTAGSIRTNLVDGLVLPGTLVIYGLANLQATLDIYDANRNPVFTTTKNDWGDTISWIPDVAPTRGVYKFTLTIGNDAESVQVYDGQFIQK